MYSRLVSMEREGRNTRYRANIPLMLETIAYLASECCSGNSAHCQPYLAEGGIEPDFLSVYCQKQTYDTEITTMDTADKTKSSEDVKETVRAGYAAIATGQRSCCCSSQRGSQADPARLAAAVGYDAESLAKLPDGANMGLSCGNPLPSLRCGKDRPLWTLAAGGFDVFQAGEKVKASGRVIGVDMTPEMLAKARKNIGQYRQRTGLDNVEFRLGEIECLPVPDNSVDVVLSNCVINLSPDKPKVWREIYRVLKSGGKVSVSDLALLKPLPDNVRDMAAALVGCVAGAVLVEETKALLEKAGFTSIVLTPKPDYVRNMQDWNDPLYKQIAETLPQGEEMADYVVSLSIEARK
ncbi:MAG: methyltransferase domain-containing protein [Bilophila wadsworthia]